MSKGIQFSYQYSKLCLHDSLIIVRYFVRNWSDERVQRLIYSRVCWRWCSIKLYIFLSFFFAIWQIGGVEKFNTKNIIFDLESWKEIIALAVMEVGRCAYPLRKVFGKGCKFLFFSFFLFFFFVFLLFIYFIFFLSLFFRTTYEQVLVFEGEIKWNIFIKYLLRVIDLHASCIVHCSVDTCSKTAWVAVNRCNSLHANHTTAYVHPPVYEVFPIV